MSHIEDYLVKGCVVTKEGDKDAFEKIEELVTEWERATYPEMAHTKMHKSVKNSTDRLKLICHLNATNVVESDRVCTFKLIAASKDGNENAILSKNVCLDHSCQCAEFQSHRGGPTGKIKNKSYANSEHMLLSPSATPSVDANGTPIIATVAVAPVESESRYLIGKKRKIEQQQDNFKEAWKLISNERVFVENSFEEKKAYLEEIGIYEASDLKDLEAEHIETLANLLKEIPRKKWTRLLNSA